MPETRGTNDIFEAMSTMRAITDEIVIEIQKLSGQVYTGRYAQRPKTEGD